MKVFALAFVLLSLTASAAEEGAWEVGALWKPGNPKFTEKGSREFESNGPMLRSIRVSKIVFKDGENCANVLERIRGRSIGKPYVAGDANRFAGWDAWTDDIDAVEGCADFPCKIKFNEPETLAIGAKPKEGRLAEVLKQIDGRVAEYAKTSHRHGYDLPEDPIDPWATFTSRGHVIPPSLLKAKPNFVARKLKFAEGNYHQIRQIFDERTFVEKGRLVRISRDVYTAHYFDGWGEWLEARCAKDGKSLDLLQDLLMEFDLLKNTDLFSRIARPKMRQGVDQESLRQQTLQADALFSK
jgi:hypothetical protein